MAMTLVWFFGPSCRNLNNAAADSASNTNKKYVNQIRQAKKLADQCKQQLT